MPAYQVSAVSIYLDLYIENRSRSIYRPTFYQSVVSTDRPCVDMKGVRAGHLYVSAMLDCTRSPRSMSDDRLMLSLPMSVALHV